MFDSEAATFVFVTAGRDDQLHRLKSHFALASSGNPQIIFVTGEAGIGKTALLRHFCTLAQETDEKLLVAWGECSDLVGQGLLGDYLPFKDILQLLTGDVDSERARTRLHVSAINQKRLSQFLLFSGKVLLEVGGDLVDKFVPGASLLESAVKAGAKSLATQVRERLDKPTSSEPPKVDQIFQQYSNVLIKLAQKQPLLLVLDDLHWADMGTLQLLFYLSRRLQTFEKLPLLLIGTYRPTETGALNTERAELLKKNVNEIRRYTGDVMIDLAPTLDQQPGRAFVDALLDSQPNRLGDDFREIITRRTEGHPLFTVELLNALDERGTLVKNAEGLWCLARAVAFDDLPDKIEAVIDERIRHLEAELQDALRCGSVEGEEFTAQVVARVQKIQERRLLTELSQELDQEARLVRTAEAIGVNRLRLYRFRFRHALVQFYLYQQLGPYERELLHGDVGQALEDLYGSETDRIAAELAYHFELGQMPDKAIVYYQKAGDQALQHFSADNAAVLYTRALTLLGSGGTPEQRFALMIGRAEAYDYAGKRDEQLADLNAALTLANQPANDAWLATVQCRFARYYQQIGQYQPAVEAAISARDAARRAGDAVLECASLVELSQANYWTWIDSKSAVESAESALTIARRIGHRQYEARALSMIGINYREAYDNLKAQKYLVEALAIAREINDRSAEADILRNLSVVSRDLRNYAMAITYARQALDLFRAIGDRWNESDCTCELAYALHWNGDYSDALDCSVSALRLAREIENVRVEADQSGTLGDVYLALGNYAFAREYYEKALTLSQKIKDEWLAGLNLIGLSQSYLELGNVPESQKCAAQALEIFHESASPGYWYWALDNMACLSERAGDLEQANDHYSRALEIARTLNQQDDLIALAQSNLARILMAQSDIEAAQSNIEAAQSKIEGAGKLAQAVFDWTQHHHVSETYFSVQLCLSCARALQAIGDLPAARTLVEAAHDLLMSRAGRITDPALRQSYLENVQANRTLIAVWKGLPDWQYDRSTGV